MKSSQLAYVFVALAATATAADWPHYRGLNHDGVSAEKIATTWPSEGPSVIWKAPLGPSFGSFAVTGGKVFAFVQRNVDGEDKEVALALDEATGKELWSTPLGKPTYDKAGGDGPRSTPAVDGGRVYIFGAYQILSCLDAKTGKIVWQHDIVKEFGGTVIRWNSAASPVIQGNLVFVNGGGAGQALLAFDKKDGAVVWKAEDDLPTHSTPVPTTIHGTRQIIFYTQKGLVSVVPQTGKVLWRFPVKFNTSSASSPIVSGDLVYCSAAYNIGATVCRVSKDGDNFSAAEVWSMPGKLMNHWTSPVCKGGYIYGVFGGGKSAGAPLKCIEMATGKEMWSQNGFGGGSATILVGGNVLVQADRGPLVLVEATSKEYHELARAEIFGGQCWTMPVVSDGKLFARNTKEAICLDVTVKTAAK